MATDSNAGRSFASRSYRLDDETIELIDGLRAVLRDQQTGEPRTATGVIRQAVRELARKHLPKKS